ncbi:hypothetical protein WME79_22785 [Sorangium sp. So ce726]|uniref:hypothetical protein n=1 Tax=Sorangium sp. So ce726 TaxID=3133319 RepID=UPI003F602979
MIELTFRLTPENGEPRDVLVRIHEPTRNPSEEEWPWDVKVDIDGGQTATCGMDPLDAIENETRHAAIVLREVYGDALDPPVEPQD